MSHYFSEANLRYNPLLYLFGCNSNVFPHKCVFCYCMINKIRNNLSTVGLKLLGS